MKPTKIMAILNATDNSFYSKSCSLDFTQLIDKAHQLVKDGADILDIGGCSSKPGSLPVSIDEELRRTIPLIKALKQELDIKISIDTFRPQVASKAIEAGVDFLNDITGFTDPEMIHLAKESALPICVMHMQKSPIDMQINPLYPKGVVQELYHWFSDKIENLIANGVEAKNIILDPGFGFGKSVADNFEIIREIETFQNLGYPLLLGTSRKSSLQKISGRSVEEALPATLAVNTYLALKGIDILRVHDVAAHKDLITVVSALQKSDLPVG